MKNNFFVLILILIFTLRSGLSLSEELEINSKKIKVDNNSKAVFLDGEVSAFDKKGNRVYSKSAEYFREKDLLKTIGNTEIITSEDFKLEGTNIIFDNKNKIISSKNSSRVVDKDGNQIFMEMFDYSINKNMFFSKGNIKIIDNKKNDYNFAEIYIDEKKRKIVGSDIKVFINQKEMKINEENEPRFFANSMSITNNKNEFEKGVFTYCKNRGKDKCPPWILQSEKIEHNMSKKTIYYQNAILKIYDFPIFYFPIFSHPDPTVKRRSGFLVPSLSDSSSIGPGLQVPYFWAISHDKDLTFSPKIYGKENPLLLAEYRQDFRNSFLITDIGYSKGYKKTSGTKTSGSRNHFFLKFNKNFITSSEKSSELNLDLQRVSNDTYLKIHDVETSLVDKDLNILENTLDYNYQTNESFFGLNVSAFEDLSIQNRNRFEYLLPYITYEKNILSDEKYGFLDFVSNFRVRNYDVNKQTEFFVNDLNWKSKKWINSLGIENQLIGKVKSVNYNADNTKEYKNDDTVSEISGVIGYLTKLGFYKNDFTRNLNHLLTPKLLIRHAPGHMRSIDQGRLKYSNLFEINKTNELDVIESGLSATIGFEYEKNTLNEKGRIEDKVFSFSAGQVISERENKDLPSKTSLDQRFSDLVGNAEFNFNKNFSFNYNFAIDQNYQEINYNELAADLEMEKAKFNLAYLEEKNHIGSEEYIKTGIDIELNNSNQLSFSTKRNLLTNSAEFYDMSYEYINDCLKAGLAYRREFYTDRDIEPENSLMFTITITPFGDINSPKFSR